jgi:Fe-S oxidoreductase
LAQAVEAEAEVLITSCPYCITHFEESRLNLGNSQAPAVEDITEILQEVIS